MARYAETVYLVRKLIAMTEERADCVSEYRHQYRIASENEAIRYLIELGLKTAA